MPRPKQCRLGRHRSDHPRPGSDAAMVTGQIVFLVRRMDAVVVEAEADHDAVHSENALELRYDRNRASHGNQHRLLVPFLRERASCLLHPGAVARLTYRAIAAMAQER